MTYNVRQLTTVGIGGGGGGVGVGGGGGGGGPWLGGGGIHMGSGLQGQPKKFPMQTAFSWALNCPLQPFNEQLCTVPHVDYVYRLSEQEQVSEDKYENV